jgi:hypothetical protein
MARLLCLSIAVVLLFLSAAVQASSIQNAEPIHKGHRHGYGPLPVFKQPPPNFQPLYVRRGAWPRIARRERLPLYIDPVPYYLGWDGNWHYFGWPGFYRGRYNGGTFGPCWTRTPIGPVWNCG